MNRSMALAGVRAAGFIGHSVAHRLLDRGEDVVGIDNFNDYYDPSLKDARAATLNARRGFRMERMRSEEHTSELQSLMRISYAVFCLKKKMTYSCFTTT